MAKRTVIIDDERITVADAAEILRMSPMGLRIALRNGKFAYFGEAWKNEEKWTYYINSNRLLEYVGIARARGVDLPEIQNDLQGKENEVSQTEVFSSLEIIKMEKEIQKLKAENKKLKGLLNQIFTEISQAIID